MTQPSAASNLVFTMRIDASDLKRLMALGASNGQNGSKPNPARRPSPSAVKQLALLGAIAGGIAVVEKNSAIFRTYSEVLGKQFGAAIDILMIPFIPIFNLLTLGMNKLIIWLIESGYLETMSKLMAKVATNLSAIADWILQVLGAIKEMDWSKAGGLIKEGLIEGIKYTLENPLTAIATALTALGAAILLSKTLGIGGALLGGGGGGGSLIGAAGAAAMGTVIAPILAAAVGSAIGIYLGKSVVDTKAFNDFFHVQPPDKGGSNPIRDSMMKTANFLHIPQGLTDPLFYQDIARGGGVMDADAVRALQRGKHIAMDPPRPEYVGRDSWGATQPGPWGSVPNISQTVTNHINVSVSNTGASPDDIAQKITDQIQKVGGFQITAQGNQQTGTNPPRWGILGGNR